MNELNLCDEFLSISSLGMSNQNNFFLKIKRFSFKVSSIKLYHQSCLSDNACTVPNTVFTLLYSKLTCVE